MDNPADSMTVYRCAAEGKDLSVIPELDDSCQTIFTLNDLVQFYKNYALVDSRIKDFCEKVTERV